MLATLYYYTINFNGYNNRFILNRIILLCEYNECNTNTNSQMLRLKVFYLSLNRLYNWVLLSGSYQITVPNLNVHGN